MGSGMWLKNAFGQLSLTDNEQKGFDKVGQAFHSYVQPKTSQDLKAFKHLTKKRGMYVDVELHQPCHQTTRLCLLAASRKKSGVTLED